MNASRRGTRKPSPEYSRVFTALFAGGFLLVTGIIGYDVGSLRGLFRGGRWVESPVWWQIALGTGLIVLAGFLIRRLPHRWMAVMTSRRRLVNVGSGKSVRARGTPDAPRAIEAPYSTDGVDE